MKEFKCPVCGKLFQRYATQVTVAEPMCSRACRNKHQETALLGRNNPNYLTGLYSEKSLCACGNEKDLRSEKCAVCAKRGFPLDGIARATDAQICQAIAAHNTVQKVAKAVGISRASIAKFIKQHSVNVGHFKPTRHRTYTREQLLGPAKSRINGTVRKFVLTHQLLEYKCAQCPLVDTWNSKPLTLHLDHKNGDPLDNHLVNLRFLCPNCHSQTATYTGKKTKCKQYKRKKLSAV